MFATVDLPYGVRLRPVEEDDAPALAATLLRNRDHLLPFEGHRPDSFWTADGQRDRLRMLLGAQADGKMAGGMLARDGEIVGYISLNMLTPAPVCGANLGYWVDAAEHGRGLATAAVAGMLRIAEDLGLHRIEAGTSPANIPSQRVLLKNGFEQFGTARGHYYVDGRWQDSHLYERILNDHPPVRR
ncbi:GNAT family N-acetyltransferase [Actinoplanes utahensis]|uniref:N-acetyltransferase domain-containing protein n=1 Tax=Actinoplanes utahensis TaxID=1869 RepID=A0A0A6UGI1_ACTUT|nr:GNAT family protein [Actinoplanes utahensis]KHD74193.1 hypothetical protein MB27_30320 [Actinoplanes utahensis]